MNTLKLLPVKLYGDVTVPSSKSAAHRALICAALAPGRSTLHSIDASEDIKATIACLTALGCSIEKNDEAIYVNGGLTERSARLDCSESGSTLRFMLPIAAAIGGSFEFTGKGRLMSRPLDEYERLLIRQGVEWFKDDDVLHIKGKLNSGDYSVAGNISSQYITGLLLALPICRGTLTLQGRLESAPYVDMTVDMMLKFGVNVVQKDSRYAFTGAYTPADVTVERDWSQAAFFIAAAALGSKVSCIGMDIHSKQGDKRILDFVRSFGATVTETDGMLSIIPPEVGAPCEYDIVDCPDLAPALAVLACGAVGQSRIVNAARLRHKESDRLLSIAAMINNLGGKAEIDGDALLINGSGRLAGGCVDTQNDHRIAMAAAIASTICTDTVEIRHPECVSKSYPAFWRDFYSLGGSET